MNPDDLDLAPIEPLFASPAVARMEGCTTRARADRVTRGDFPQPDVPSTGKGTPNYWKRSTLLRAREERAARGRAIREQREAAAAARRAQPAA